MLFVPFWGMTQILPEKLWVTIPDIDAFEKSSLVNDYNIVLYERAFPSSKSELLTQVYELTTDMYIDLYIEAANNSLGVLSHVDYVPKFTPLFQPNDLHFALSSDWSLEIVNAQQAWDYTHGDTNIIIGISDFGYFLGHEDLASEIYYLDTTMSPNNIYHGTAVATIAGGATDNNAGKSHIGFDCRLWLGSYGYDVLLEMSNAGVPVINASWGTCYSSYYGNYVAQELYNNGTVLVAAAGNSNCGATGLMYPASHDHVISVASIGFDTSHIQVGGSTHTHNDSVDLCAPGYRVSCTYAPGVYSDGFGVNGYVNGSSFAAPHVTGTVALILAVNPCLTVDSIEMILKSTAVNIDSLNPAYAGQLGSGLLNTGEAVKLAYDLYCPLSVGFLPIELGSFTAEAIDNENLIKWLTITEKGNDYFTLERSTDGFVWYSVTTEEGAGNSTEPISYQYIDRAFTNGVINYYRLKQTNYNGEYSFSDVVTVNNTVSSVQFIKAVNTLGQEIDLENARGFIFLVYSNGSIKKTYK